MPQGWKTHVWQTDADTEDGRKWRGFFYDKPAAEAWVKRQTKGAFEINDTAPTP